MAWANGSTASSPVGGNTKRAAVDPPAVAVGTERPAVAAAGIDAAEPVVWDQGALEVHVVRIVDAPHSQFAVVVVVDGSTNPAQTTEEEQHS